MYKLLFILATVLCAQVNAQNTAAKPVIIYGKCPTTILRSEPHNQWFNANYDTYKPDSTTIAQIKKQSLKDISIEIFFGSWCGDSRREVPRFLKLADALSIQSSTISLVGVGGSDSLYKQSPGHEEEGKGIFRVPTFVIYQKGKEIARINEFPVYSLEKDLLQILSGKTYEPNYHSFASVKDWIDKSEMHDENVSSAGLANQLLGKTRNEYELNSLGYLLLKQNRKKEALRIFQVNYHLYPESANVLSSLGEGYLENDEAKKAIVALERSLALNKDPLAVPEILKLLYQAKEKPASQ